MVGQADADAIIAHASGTAGIGSAFDIDRDGDVDADDTQLSSDHATSPGTELILLGRDSLVAVAVSPRLVLTPSVLGDSATGEGDVLPASAEWIDEWTGFYVEVWVSTPNSSTTGIVAAQIDLAYDTTCFTGTAIEYGPAFEQLQTGTIDDLAGVVDDLGAGTFATDVGDDQYALFARVRFEPTEMDVGIDVDPAGPYLTPFDHGITVSDAEAHVVGALSTLTELDAPPNTELWPVMYDMDDDGRVGFGDFAFFASAFQQHVGEPGADYACASDFDHDGYVDFGDFAFFAQNFQRSKADAIELDYHADFPELWRPEPLGFDAHRASPTASAAPLTDKDLQPNLARATHRLQQIDDPARTKTPPDVAVTIAGLPSNRLGQSGDDHVGIDAKAAGYGWFIDSTLGDDGEFSRRAGTDELMASLDSLAHKRADLLTAVMHELGHLVDLEHSDRHDAMNPELPLSTRRLFGEEDLLFSPDSDARDVDDYEDAFEFAPAAIDGVLATWRQ